MSQDQWDRFKTGQALKGRLLQALVGQASAGAVLSAGALLGPWKVVELLGSGGMSHVYLAERADGQFEQLVALKLVRKNVALIDRLRHERQIVATLRHPHIVSLVDGGETDEGDLWFAMALVEGVAIDQYAQDHQLDWRTRLQLFDAVCGAVEYAHGRALIHRDIKPANILVDEHGLPRLLDFGIALTLENSGGDGSQDHVLTPGYASPEQLAGQAITTTSDIFQLGLVLKAMLVRAPGDAHWIVLPASVRSDLKLLLARATANEPQARYATVAALREDVANLLARRPLAQQRESLRVRGLRLIERNRVTFTISVVAVVTLAAALTVAALRLRDERDRALVNAQRARAVSEFLVSTLSQANPYAQQKGAVTVLEAMDHAATRLDEHLADSPEVRRELREAIGNVYLNIDEAKRCLAVLGTEQAASDLQRATATDQGRMLIMRSECHLALDERDDAWRLLEAAQSAIADASRTGADQLRAWIMVDQAQLLSLNGKLIDANVLLEAAIPLAARSGSAEQEYRGNRMLGQNLQQANEHERALALLQRAHALATQTLGATHRSTLTTAGTMAISLGKLDRLDEAESTIKDALVAAESIRQRGGTPDIVIAQLRDNYAGLLWQQMRFGECIEQAGAAFAIYKRVAPDTSSQGFNPSWRVATCAYQGGQLDLAFDHATQALHYAENGVPVGVINALRMLAAISARRGQLDASVAFLARADSALSTTEVANKAVFSALHLTRALLAVRSGDAAAARTHLQRADDSMRESGINQGWLAQERGEVAAMIESLR